MRIRKRNGEMVEFSPEKIKNAMAKAFAGQKQEIDALQQSVEAAERSGESLRSVFERMSRQLGRKPNSIRNFYYAQVRAAQGEDGARATPFETFSPEEVERLVEQVLTARAQGVSVRACVRQMADGDRTRMLRYQNKYRSTASWIA